MDLWSFLQVPFNLFLLFGVIYCLYRLRTEDAKVREEKKRLREMARIKEAMDTAVQDAIDVSKQIGEEISRKQDIAKEISQELERQKTALNQIANRLRTSEPSSTGKDSAEKRDPREEKYLQAIQLATEGLNPEAIAKRMKLPQGEIELLLSLRT